MSKPRNNPGLPVFAAEIPQLGLFTLEKVPEDLGRGLFGLEKSHNQGPFTLGKIEKQPRKRSVLAAEIPQLGPFGLEKAPEPGESLGKVPEDVGRGPFMLEKVPSPPRKRSIYVGESLTIP
ncbi:hypothetical protein PISMIDRAFT_18365 [Pisolithus microcarpus 441]|uniref:Uncharacterized protein n=1 Tax=Pisolithus microcarpus 441 TaxID=765257 RepID=A0A0C9YG60_9AGAM|nr:hypothetical protein PISMIDRAFT_18365 [Pisolithus microcarpus 441]